MLTSVYDEKFEYQRDFVNHLVKENGFIERKNTSFNRAYAMDIDLLFEFLYKTQEDTMLELKAIYKNDLRETLVNFINGEITKKGSSLIDVLKNGVEISNKKITLMYTKPATDYNKDLVEKYENNIFSVMQEVYPKEKERVDLIIFLNGLAIIAIELKSEFSGQNIEDAIKQYTEERDPKSRLFLWKAGCFVCFAMDTSVVMMTTKLDWAKTFFLPFNKGRGEGIYTGKGNPENKDGLPVSYMWEEVLKKDSILDLINKFIFIERKEEEDEDGKTKIKETIIFPRFHQLDLIRKLIEDVKVNKTSQNYLIQHSAGSGKTNSIAWLAHRLVSLHDSDNRVIYDTTIIVTDRLVVDRQLQKAVMTLDHAVGLIKVMDNSCSSQDLKLALEGNTKIIATTIQKFPYIVDELKNLKNKNFAVIIDEAHSSTAGKNMQAVTQALGSEDDEFEDEDDFIIDQIKRSGKQANVSMFAFTATPKATTLRMFGRLNKNGNYEAFHLYSMKQAIEEGFILDVLQNYTTTLLASDLTANKIKDLLTSIEAYDIIDPIYVDEVNEIVFKKRKGNITSKEASSLQLKIKKAKLELDRYSEKDQKEFIAKLKNFKRFYEYLIQVSCFEDLDVHKYYIYISYLLNLLTPGESMGMDIRDKVKADNFVQVKGETHKDEKQAPKPLVKLPMADPIDIGEAKKERLSEIIAEINAKTGSKYDVDVATKAAMQIRDIMMKSDELKTSAKNNSENDFKFSYFSNAENALIEGLGQNQGFFGYLLDHPDAQKEVLGIFMSEIYKSLRKNAH